MKVRHNIIPELWLIKNDEDISLTMWLFNCSRVSKTDYSRDDLTGKVFIWFLRYFFKIISGISISRLNLYPCKTATVLLFNTIMIFFETSTSNLWISFKWIYTDFVSINFPERSLISKCAKIHLSKVYDGCLMRQYNIDAFISIARIEAPVNLTIFW